NGVLGDGGEEQSDHRDGDLPAESARKAWMNQRQEERSEAGREVDECEEEHGGADQVGEAAEQARDISGDAEDDQSEIRCVERLLLLTERLGKKAVDRHGVGQP